MKREDLIEKSFYALFNELVPKSGVAETVAGEILRAANRVFYRWWNDGDMAGKGYGIETVNSSVRYLRANTGDMLSIHDIDLIADGDDEEVGEDYYNELVYQVLRDVTNYVIDNFDELNVPNDKDSLECLADIDGRLLREYNEEY